MTATVIISQAQNAIINCIQFLDACTLATPLDSVAIIIKVQSILIMMQGLNFLSQTLRVLFKGYQGLITCFIDALNGGEVFNFNF
jgi:hypothetical protein